MTKYISDADHGNIDRLKYHKDPDCDNVDSEMRELTEKELQAHNITPCTYCADGMNAYEVLRKVKNESD